MIHFIISLNFTVNPFVKVTANGFNGDVITYEMIDGVETKVRQSSSGYQTHAVLGYKFQSAMTDERQSATVPAEARPSMDAAAAENPPRTVYLMSISC